MPETISINEWDRLSSNQKKALTKINFIGTKQLLLYALPKWRRDISLVNIQYL